MIQGYLIAGALGLVCSVGAYLYGRHDGKQIEEARQLAEQAIVDRAAQAMQERAAEAISKIKVINRTNETRLEREIVKVPDFSKCDFGPDVKRVLDDALTNKATPEPVSDSVLPGTNTPP